MCAFVCLVNVSVQRGCGDPPEFTEKLHLLFQREIKQHSSSSRMRSGWIRGFLVVLVLVLVSLYLSNIKTQVSTHSGRLQKAHHLNETIGGQAILGRMDKMQDNINRLRESIFSLLLCAGQTSDLIFEIQNIKLISILLEN